MNDQSTLIARLSYAFFVFPKKGTPDLARFNSIEEAIAESDRLRAEMPEVTFIIARELLRATPKDREI